MRTYPLHWVLGVGVLLALGLYAQRLGFLPDWAAWGLWAGYLLLALWGFLWGGWRAAPLALGLLAPLFPPLAFLGPLGAALALGRTLPEKAQAAFYGWALVWPALALLLVWQVFPTLYAFYLSLFDRVNFLRPAAFAGLQNYRILLEDPLFWRALGNTFWYVVFTVPTGLLLATFVAILLNTQVAFLGLYRTLFFLPYITALTAAAAVWRWIYHPEFGFLNWLLHTPGLDWLNTPTGVFALLLRPLGVELQGFLAGPSLAFVAVLAMSVWPGGASGHPQGVLRGRRAGRGELLPEAPPHHLAPPFPHHLLPLHPGAHRGLPGLHPGLRPHPHGRGAAGHPDPGLLPLQQGLPRLGLLLRQRHRHGDLPGEPGPAPGAAAAVGKAGEL